MGKFGIILAFLLSIAAAGGSYYLYQGWVEERTVRSSVEAKYDQVKEKMITVQSEKEQITAKSEEYRTKAEAMQAQLEKLQTEQTRIDSEKAALEKQLKSHQEIIAGLQTKMAELEKKAKEAQAACGVTPADLKTESFPSSEPSPTASASVPSATAAANGDETSPLLFKPVTPEGSVAPVSSAATAMPPAVKEEPAIATQPKPETPVAAAVEPAESTGAPATTGAAGAKVLTVNRKFNFVVINQGLQEGLKMGDKLKVLKQGKEVATVQIEKLYDKFSAATLVEEDPKQQVVEGDEIRKG